MKKVILLSLLLTFSALLASCSQEDAGNSLLVASSLRGQPVEKVELSCPEGQTCPWVQALKSVDLEPVGETQMCTRIYGGPEEITLVGQVEGEGIEADFNRSGGCEIARFESLNNLFKSAGIKKEDLFPRGSVL